MCLLQFISRSVEKIYQQKFGTELSSPVSLILVIRYTEFL